MAQDPLSVQVRATAEDGILVSIQPPVSPSQNINHVPCAIVLAIDVSGSMSKEAALPQGQESTGLTILDLVKHAARTIVATLNDGDRLALVTFSNEAKTVHSLAPMTPAAKKAILNKISDLTPQGATNLWGGIREGIKLFEQAGFMSGQTSSLFVLSDGQPNHMCPPQGYIPKLQPILQKLKAEGNPPILINTFGFGYHIRSGLLQSLAEISGGTYAFIPDCGMIGTVFVHAVANLYSTYAVEATLHFKLLNNSTSIAVCGYSDLEDEDLLTVSLGSLLYGHTRDILLQAKGPLSFDFEISMELQCFCDGDYTTRTFPSVGMSGLYLHPVPPAEISYHRMRTVLCSILDQTFPRGRDGERRACSKYQLSLRRQSLGQLIQYSRHFGYTDELNQSIIDDLTGEEPIGQVSLAVSSNDYFERWGKHYLLSLFNAHHKQYCNSFKDPGPLQYGTQSPLFIRCRDELNETFDDLPPPKPAVIGIESETSFNRKRVTSMRSYNNRQNPCFDGYSRVKLSDGKTTRSICLLIPGDKVWTPKGPRKVAAILKSKRQSVEMYVFGRGLKITPWHPICHGNRWLFPIDTRERSVQTRIHLYSIMLEPEDCPDAHAISVGGVLCVTLGHGLTTATGDDSRGHPFFGNYKLVAESLNKLETFAGARLCGGILRDADTGLACGFLPGSADD
ncbi:hypothetical protein NA57DRAFT_49815 [Rhizodiscina lignyota]|uniref:VWFA domain-containing protein n=1 Tax=Rhizodiscina lignyota TaxID=1504668 RepID=A0A9P4I0K5_9PEZI|nr:hypothetical protein NA57DRAFT_49815 [Rhizodiscina lignyota]